MNKNRSVLIFVLFLTALASHAAIAIGKWTTYTQSDGTTIRTKLCGNERLHYYITEDHVPLMRAANGDFHYLRASGFGISTTGILAHKKEQRTKSEQGYISSIEAIRNVNHRQQQDQKRLKARRQRSVSYAKTRTLSDAQQKRGLVILVNFIDTKLNKNALDTWTKILNEDGFNGSSIKTNSSYTTPKNVPGSVHNYFMDQSNGLFDITFDVVGPIQLSKPRYYYGQNSSDPNAAVTEDINACDMVVEACEAAKSKVNFADYDWDNDGEADQVLILYAGEGENIQGNPESLIWPHEYVLSAYPKYSQGYVIDGIRINTYACVAEMLYEKNLSGLGTFCHEFAHCLGFPDFYDTVSDNEYQGGFGLLDSGSSNGNSWFPCNFTAYEKAYCGWTELIELDKDTEVSDLKPISEGGKGYYIENKCNDESISEFYVLENRQQTNWDKYIPATGLVIIHYDLDEEAWYYNQVNADIDHLCAAIIPANNSYKDEKGYPYPYNGNNALTNTTTPAAKVFNQNQQGTFFMDKSVTDIAQKDGLISFKYNGLQQTGIKNSDIAMENAMMGKPVRISDLMGRTIEKVTAYTGTSHLPSGVYIVTDSKGNSIKVNTH